jgi:hypothetical protein
MERGNGPELAMDITTPPHPVSTEFVPCVLHFLDNATGVCAPAPGGPLGKWPLVGRAVLDRENHTGVALGSLLVGIMTLGMIAPGGGQTTTSLILESFQDNAEGTYTVRDSALRTAYRESRGWGEKRIHRTMVQGPVDREELAALVVGFHSESRGQRTARYAIHQGLPLLHPEERYSVLRAVLGHTESWSSWGPAYLIAAREYLPDEHRPEQLEALAVTFGPWRTLGLCLLDQRCAFSYAVINGLPEGETMPSPILEDAGVVRFLSDDDKRVRVAGLLMEGTVEAERPEVWLQMLEVLSRYDREDMFELYAGLHSALDDEQQGRLRRLVGDDAVDGLAP